MLDIKTEQEGDGRWLAEVTAPPGVMVYGDAEGEARIRAIALALRAIADRIETGERLPEGAQQLIAVFTEQADSSATGQESLIPLIGSGRGLWGPDNSHG